MILAIQQLQSIFPQILEMRAVEKQKIEALLKQNTGIYLYSAGNVGCQMEQLLTRAGYDISGFIDRAAENPQANFRCNSPVMTPEKAKATLPSDILVLVCMYNIRVAADVVRDLQEQGFQHVVYFTELRDTIDFSGNGIWSPIGYDTRSIQENIDNILCVRELLAHDALSQRVFDEVFSYAVLGDNAFTLCTQYDQYFSYNLYTQIETEILFDCGAHNGDTFLDFVRSNPKFTSYYALEADTRNVDLIKDSVLKQYDAETQNKVHLIAKPVSDKIETISFESFGTSYSRESEAGTVQLETTTIDHELAGKPITMLKVAVEGFEMRTLRGSEQTIRKHHPVCAVCAFHKISDLWEIPLYLRSLYPDYTFYFRNYQGLVEYVCYAIPPDRLIQT